MRFNYFTELCHDFVLKDALEHERRKEYLNGLNSWLLNDMILLGVIETQVIHSMCNENKGSSPMEGLRNRWFVLESRYRLHSGRQMFLMGRIRLFIIDPNGGIFYRYCWQGHHLPLSSLEFQFRLATTQFWSFQLSDHHAFNYVFIGASMCSYHLSKLWIHSLFYRVWWQVSSSFKQRFRASMSLFFSLLGLLLVQDTRF